MAVTFVPADGSVTDAKVSASAAIALTKLASTGVVGSGPFEIAAALVSVANGAGLVVGATARVTTSAANEFQVLGTAAADSSMTLGQWSAAATGPGIHLVKSRNATIGSSTIVQDNDVQGGVYWHADDGTDFVNVAASFHVEVDDASPAANDVGAAFVWRSQAGGAAAIADRMRLSAAGDLTPGVSDGGGLGTTALPWGDLRLASGGVIDMNGGGYRFTHTGAGHVVMDTTHTVGRLDMKNASSLSTGMVWQLDAGQDMYMSNNENGRMFLAANGSVWVTITQGGNVCLGGLTAAGTTAARCLALSNSATAPSASADMVHLFAADAAGAGTAALAIWQEDAPSAEVIGASTHVLRIVANGTMYKVLLSNV